MIIYPKWKFVAEDHANYNFSWMEFNEISMEAIGTRIFCDFKDSHYFAGYVGSLMRQKWSFWHCFKLFTDQYGI
jgi:hypothetical protein